MAYMVSDKVKELRIATTIALHESIFIWSLFTIFEPNIRDILNIILRDSQHFTRFIAI
jgi:hypothetical protein